MSDDFLNALYRAPSPDFARALRERLHALEAEPSGRSGSWRPSFATTVLVVALMAGGSLAFPQVRATARALLDLFRQRTVADVTFDPARVEPLRARIEGKSPVLLLFGESQGPEGVELPSFYPSPEEAAAATALPLLTPTWLPDGMTLEAVRSTGAARDRLAVDRDRLHETFDRLDLQEIRVPRRLAEGVVELYRPLAVTLEYGGAGDHLRLLQGNRPHLRRQPDFDLALCGEIGLRVLGVEAGEAHRLAASVDWSATLAVPMPAGAGEFGEVAVRGQKGVMIASRPGIGSDAPGERMLLWTEGERLYALTGTLGAGDLARVAESLR